jgi:hypothetical protein
MHPFIDFCQSVRILHYRNKRLKLNRLSLQADFLKERSKASGLDFSYLMTADLVLWLRGVQWIRSQTRRLRSWWPDTLVFVSFRPGPPFEMFAQQNLKSILKKSNRC